jgi:hypothetical protein
MKHRYFLFCGKVENDHEPPPRRHCDADFSRGFLSDQLAFLSRKGFSVQYRLSLRQQKRAVKAK